jgi:hypothetical protein
MFHELALPTVRYSAIHLYDKLNPSIQPVALCVNGRTSNSTESPFVAAHNDVWLRCRFIAHAAGSVEITELVDCEQY